MHISGALQTFAIDALGHLDCTISGLSLPGEAQN